METLSSQFKNAISNVSLGELARRAQEAHKEIRGTLEASPDLKELGIDTVLIGSYRRGTAICPGKDVDVFAKLTEASRDNDPTSLYEIVASVLINEYGDRAVPQSRSIRIDFPNEFSVDVVPAVRSGERWAIPSREAQTWGDPDAGWVETDPERLTELTTAQNKTPTVDGQGAYLPVVKLMRQTRRHHLDKGKPAGFYFELLTYWTFEDGISGGSFAELVAAALRGAADQLASGTPVTDPVLGTPYGPAPSSADLNNAAAVFAQLADNAERALRESRCAAAVLWREILGRNERGQVFPLPPNCDEHGNEITTKRRVAAVGSGEAGGFA